MNREVLFPCYVDRTHFLKASEVKIHMKRFHPEYFKSSDFLPDNVIDNIKSGIREKIYDSQIPVHRCFLENVSTIIYEKILF